MNAGNLDFEILEPPQVYVYRWEIHNDALVTAALALNQPLIADVNCSVRNHRYINGVLHGPEMNVGRLLYAAYGQAFKMARRRFNIKAPEDSVLGDGWLEEHPQATVMAYNIRNVDALVEAPEGAGYQGLVQHAAVASRHPHSMVRAKIVNIPCLIDGEEENRTLNTNNVAIHPGNNKLTCKKLFSHMMRKHFIPTGAGGFDHAGSGTLLSLNPIPASFQIIFQFMFVKTTNWRPLLPAENYEQRYELNPHAFLLPEDQPLPQAVAVVQPNNQLFPVAPEPIPLRPRTTAVQRVRSPIFTRARGSLLTPRTRSGATYSQLRSNPGLPFGMPGGSGKGEEKGIYAQLKDRIYIRKSLDDYFVRSKACIGVPFTEDDLCFPMAFMRSQKRTWKIDGTGVLDHVEEGRTELLQVQFAMEEDDMDIEVPEKTSFFDETAITLFDTTKQRIPRVGSHGKTMYVNEKEDLSKGHLDTWIWAAMKLHEVVEEEVGESVNVKDLGECMAAYSYVFDVVISIYAMEMKGQRVLTSKPEWKEDNKEISFIGLLLKGDHLHAISHMRDFHKSEINPMSTNLFSFCDFCSTLCYSYKRDLKHQNKCFRTPGWELCESAEVIKAHRATQMECRDKIQHLPEGKNRQNRCQKCGKVVGDSDICCEGALVHPVRVAACKSCTDLVGVNYYNKHHCYMKPRKEKEPLRDETIFAWDLESMQLYHEEVDQHVHECILSCLRAVYDDRYWSFRTIQEFVDFLLTEPAMEGATILAHNGGGYDHQFILQYLESKGIGHKTIPRPGTIHKYLMLEITLKGGDKSIRMLDFMMMMTDSLRNIGKAFKLPVTKGDFPHRFSLPEHLEYSGRLPDPLSPKDWYGFKDMKNQNELDEAREFWNAQGEIYCTCEEECHCGKPPWVFRDQLEEYCKKDVDVLAGACRAYRDQARAFAQELAYDWKTEGIDPFQYMTQSQIALALFTQGKEKRDIAITHEKIRFSFRSAQICWMEAIMDKNRQEGHPIFIQHAGNSVHEYYDVETKTYCDGYCWETKTVYEYFDCFLDGCPACYPEKVQSDEMHPVRNISWKLVKEDTEKRLISLRMNAYINDIQVHWAHSDEPEWKDHSMGKVMKLRDFFYGGRTEVFAAYATVEHDPNMELLHHDVCSLYPYVCSWKELPIGIPTIYFRNNIDVARLHPNHPNRFFGFARLRIRPNTKDIIAILPQRKVDDSGFEKLIYDLNEKEGCWHTELIYLAMEHQYEILEIYEVWDWPESERSTTLMRGYMQFFLRMKQEAEGWSKLGKSILNNTPEEEITEAQKEEIATMIETNNGGFAKPRLEKVEKNPVLRQLAKIFLNCLWGKLCQKNCSEVEQTIFGYKQYLELLSNPLIDRESVSFRHVGGLVFKSRYKLVDQLQETNRFLNVPIAASVTAHAQVVLMRQMFLVKPERVLYCDTDSIMFLREKGLPPLNKSGLGQWEDEHPGETVTRFWALAPKCYLMEIKSPEETSYSLKCKGVRTTETNRARTKFDKIHAMIEAAVFERDPLIIEAETMTIHPNSTNSLIPYGVMCTRYGVKRIQVVFGKRNLCLEKDTPTSQLSDFSIIRLHPFGYTGNLQNERTIYTSQTSIPSDLRGESSSSASSSSSSHAMEC